MWPKANCSLQELELGWHWLPYLLVYVYCGFCSLVWYRFIWIKEFLSSRVSAFLFVFHFDLLRYNYTDYSLRCNYSDYLLRCNYNDYLLFYNNTDYVLRSNYIDYLYRNTVFNTHFPPWSPEIELWVFRWTFYPYFPPPCPSPSLHL